MDTLLARGLALAGCALVFASASGSACRPTPSPQDATEKPVHDGDAPADATSAAMPPDAQVTALVDAAVEDDAPSPDDDPMANHHNTREELLALFTIKDF